MVPWFLVAVAVVLALVVPLLRANRDGGRRRSGSGGWTGGDTGSGGWFGGDSGGSDSGGGDSGGGGDGGGGGGCD